MASLSHFLTFSLYYPMNETEYADLMDALATAQLGKLVNALLDPACFTRNGRLNKSAVMRALHWKEKTLRFALEQLRATIPEWANWHKEKKEHD